MKDGLFTRRLNLPLETTPRRLRMVRFLRIHGPMIVGAVVLLATVGGLTLSLFVRSSAALERQLRETLRATAVTAAHAIDGDDLAFIAGPEDMAKPEYVRVWGVLRNVVADVPQARFAYVLRRTDDPDTLSFVADADAYAGAPILAADRDGNGTVDSDEEPSYPGERYDVADIPALRDRAFREPTTDPRITIDQWGTLLSGYAPVRSHTTGEVVAVLGIDMDAAEFVRNTRSILSPFAVILIMILTCILAAGVALLVESRQLSALARVNAERSGLLQLTFHQLGEPITILQWAIESLDDGKDDVETLKKILPENLVDMHEGVRRLGSIIDTLQEAEKVELRAFENHPVEQDLKTFTEEAVAIAAPSSTRVSIEASDGTFSFDPHLLTIVLRRIIENALEFSRADTAVRVRAMGDGRWLGFDVSDAGCGIPSKDLPRLFEKYRRASNATNMKPDGNGLGLYIARGILEIMGGDIHIESTEGQGTTVSIRVPAHPRKCS